MVGDGGPPVTQPQTKLGDLRTSAASNQTPCGSESTVAEALCIRSLQNRGITYTNNSADIQQSPGKTFSKAS